MNTQKTMKSRLLAMLLSLMMIFTMLPMSAFAAEGDVPTDASGVTQVQDSDEPTDEETSSTPADSEETSTAPNDSEETSAAPNEGEETSAAPVCTCTEKCSEENVNSACEVCKNGFDQCEFAEAPAEKNAYKTAAALFGAQPSAASSDGIIFDSNTKTITGYTTGSSKDVLIPATIGGVEVLYIGANAFSGQQLTSITFASGCNVQTIGASAFMTNPAITSLVLPTTVTSIGASAFSGCAGLTSFTIPDGVTSIADSTFANCTKLTTVTCKTNVTSIGSSAFMGCSAFTGISDISKVTTIGSYAFYGCALTTFTIPDGVTKINSGTFSSCKLTSIAIPDGVTEIGSSAFSSNSAMTSITLAKSSKLTTIGGSAFYNCKFASITLPSGMASIGSGAFSYCSALTDINIPDRLSTAGPTGEPWSAPSAAVYWKDVVKVLGDTMVFNTTTGTITKYIGTTANAEVTIPATIDVSGNSYDVKAIASYIFANTKVMTVDIQAQITAIPQSAFNSCTYLTSVTLPDTVTVIGTAAFQYDSRLTSITLPAQLVSIGDYAFYSCRFTSITIPGTVESISGDAFAGTTSLKEIRIPGLNSNEGPTGEPWSAPSAAVYWKDVVNVLDDTMVFNTTTGTITKYIGTTTGAEVTIPQTIIVGANTYDVKAIASYIFAGTSVTNVDIQAQITAIPEYAFYNCYSLTGVTLPNTVTGIGDYAFNSCSKLGSISLPDSVTKIGSSAFMYSGLTSIVLSDNVSTIESYAFSYCSSLTAAVLPKNLKAIPNSLFASCTKLASIELPSGITSIGSYAFQSCSYLTEIAFPDGLLSIGGYAFYGCTGISNIVLPDSVTTIGSAAFGSCTSLKQVEIGNLSNSTDSKITYIASDAFTGSNAITSLLLDREREQNFAASSPWGAPNSVVAYWKGEIPVFNHTVTDVAGAYQRTLNIWGSVDGASVVLQKVNVPTGFSGTYTSGDVSVSAQTWGSEGAPNSYTVISNSTYPFTGTAASGAVNTYNVVIDDIGIPSPITGSSSAYLSVSGGTDSVTAAQVAALFGASATADNDAALTVTVSDADLTRVKALTNEGETAVITLTATDTNSSNPLDSNSPLRTVTKQVTLTATTKTTPAAPTATIGYINEVLQGLTASADYKINGTTYTASADGTIAIQATWLSTTITIVKVGDDTNNDSKAQSLAIPARGAAPDVNAAESVTVNSITLPAGTDWEYSADGITWTDNRVFSGLSDATQYTCYVRIKGTATTLASNKATVIAYTAVAAPTVTGNAETISKKADGSMTGLTAAMEYSTTENGTYTKITDPNMGFAAGTYYVRYAAKTNYDASPATKVIINAGNKLAINLPASPEGYTLTADKTQLDWHDTVTFTYALKPGYTENSDTFFVKLNGANVVFTDGKYIATNIENDVTITVGGVSDTSKPTAEIKLGTNTWNALLNNITFGLFFKDTQTITLTAQDVDTGSGVKTIEYFVSNTAIADPSTITGWTAYTDSFDIDPNNKYVIYVKATDNANNITYISSNGMVLDSIAPAITGIENGGKYYGDKTFTVADDYLSELLIDGHQAADMTAVQTIAADNASHTVKATDQAGNVTEYTFEVYKIYTVTFNADGNTLATVSVNHGSAATAPTIPVKVGYDKTAPVWDKAFDSVTSDLTITAVYTKNEPGKVEHITPSDNVGGADITNTPDELKELVPLTQEDKDKIELGESVKIYLVVKDVGASVDAADKAKAEEILKQSQKLGMYLDISLFKQIGSDDAVKIPNTNGKITVTFKVPENLLNGNADVTRTYQIIRVHNGVASTIDATYNAADQTVTFETDAFSTYALAYTDTTKSAKDTTSPKTGDNSNMGLWIALLFISGDILALTIIYKRKKIN